MGALSTLKNGALSAVRRLTARAQYGIIVRIFAKSDRYRETYSISKEITVMYAVAIRGKNVVGEEKGLRMPSDDELRSRYKPDMYSRLEQEGRKTYKVSSTYQKSDDVMKRRK